MCGIVSNSVNMFKELLTKDTVGVESKGTEGRMFSFREVGIFGSLAVLGLNKKLCWIVGVAKMGARIRLDDGDICEGDPVVEVLCAIRPCFFSFFEPTSKTTPTLDINCPQFPQ